MREPEYIKVNLSNIDRLYDLPSSNIKVLYSLLSFMDNDNKVITTQLLKEKISKNTGVSYSTVCNTIHKLSKAEIITKVCNVVYRVDPTIFSKQKYS